MFVYTMMNYSRNIVFKLINDTKSENVNFEQVPGTHAPIFAYTCAQICNDARIHIHIYVQAHIHTFFAMHHSWTCTHTDTGVERNQPL